MSRFRHPYILGVDSPDQECDLKPSRQLIGGFATAVGISINQKHGIGRQLRNAAAVVRRLGGKEYDSTFESKALTLILMYW